MVLLHCSICIFQTQSRRHGLKSELKVRKGSTIYEQGRRAILNKLIEEKVLKNFYTKYMGTKRFGLDGAESLIPAMEQIIKRGGNLGVKDIIIGMPHAEDYRGIGKCDGEAISSDFHQFQGGSYKPEDVDGSGDVKYHLGASSDRDLITILFICL